MKGDSTTNQFLYIVPQIRSAWQIGNICQAAFMDVDGALENVWHSGLHAKLKQACITGYAFKLFESYLFNIHQTVVVDDVKYDKKPLKAGIPQGSCLGLLLFILYINNIKIIS